MKVGSSTDAPTYEDSSVDYYSVGNGLDDSSEPRHWPMALLASTGYSVAAVIILSFGKILFSGSGDVASQVTLSQLVIGPLIVLLILARLLLLFVSIFLGMVVLLIIRKTLHAGILSWAKVIAVGLLRFALLAIILTPPMAVLFTKWGWN